MAKISTQSSIENNKDNKRKKVYDDQSVDLIKQKLRPGESFRKHDGLFIFRPTKKDYDGPETVNPVYAPSLDELRKKEVELLSRLNAQLSTVNKKRTLNDEYKLWKQLKTGVRESTKSNYVYMYEHYVLPSKLGQNYLRLITKSDIKAFYLSLLDRTALKVNTLDNIQGVLYQVFEMAREDRIIIGNPSNGALTEIKKSCDESDERVALTVAEQYAFLFALEKQTKWQDLFTVLLLTGMRAGELCGLQWSDIDFEENIIRVSHNLVYYAHVSGDGHTGYEMHTPKSKAGCRDIPMFPLVRECLLRIKKRQEESGLKCAVRIDGYDDFCFLNRFNAPFHHSTLNQALKRIILKYNDETLEDKKKIGNVLLPVFTCHVLRHTCATRLIENKCNPLAVKSVLGHKSLKVTLDIYVTVTENFKKKEFGMKKKGKVVYPDIFSEQLNGNKSKDNSSDEKVQEYLPKCQAHEIGFITQLYSEFTQKGEDEVIGFENL